MPLILPGNVASALGGAYEVANSVRFDGSNAKLTKSQSGTSTNDKKGTFSWWFKRSKVDSTQYFINMESGQERFQWYILTSGAFSGNYRASNGSPDSDLALTGAPKFLDPSAWYHFCLAWDTTDGTQLNRLRFYVNNTEYVVTQSQTIAQNTVFPMMKSSFGSDLNIFTQGSQNYCNGYAAEVVFIDGQQLTPSSFGEYDEDSPTIWKPKDVSGLTFGTIGYYLDFEDSSALGNDVSGNNNDFTETNLVATDQSTDTCTNNFCTLNPLTLQDSDFVLSEGNLKISIGGNNERKAVLGTFGLTAGKWYWEVKYISTSGQAFSQIGISDVIQGTEASSENGKMGYFAYDYGYRGEKSSGSGGFKTNNGTYSNYGDAWTTGDIIGVAVDLDNNAIYFSKNGSFQESGAVGDPTSGASRTNATFNITAASSTGTGAYFPAIGKEDSDDPVFEFNFGGTNSASFTISSGNADANGYGNFEYAPPSGFLSLCTKNVGSSGG